MKGISAEGLADNFHGGPIDFNDVFGVAVAVEHDARAAEGVGQNAVRAGFGIAALDAQHLFGMRQVPLFAAVALFQAGEHQLGAHGAVAEQGTLFKGFEQWLFHGTNSLRK